MKKDTADLDGQGCPAVAHGGNHATLLNGGNLRTQVAPQERAALHLTRL